MIFDEVKKTKNNIEFKEQIQLFNKDAVLQKEDYDKSFLTVFAQMEKEVMEASKEQTEMENIKAVFTNADTDKLGRISSGELRKILAEVDSSNTLTEQELNIAFEQLNVDHDGFV